MGLSVVSGFTFEASAEKNVLKLRSFCQINEITSVSLRWAYIKMESISLRRWENRRSSLHFPFILTLNLSLMYRGRFLLLVTEAHGF